VQDISFLKGVPRSVRSVMNQSLSRGVSILIPAYNASLTISATLISVVLTRPLRSEVLVYIDGGETNSKVLSWLEARGRVKVFRPGYRAGVAKAMNFLIDQARYDIVARIDADDIALPMRYGQAIRKIRTNRADVVFSNAVLFGRGIKFFPFLPQFAYRIPTDLAPYFLQIVNPFVQSTMVANKKALLDVGGYLDSLSEDYELILRLASKKLRLERTRSYGVLYRVHPSQLSSQTNFQSKVDDDPLVQAGLENLRSKLKSEDAEHDLGQSEEEIEKYLESRSLGFLIRKRFLNSLAEIILKLSNLQDRSR
jgi:glycosyltransferase involved in cell wall biosynthesis